MIHYPQTASAIVPLDVAACHDAQSGARLFPYKTVAAAAGMLLIPVVSRPTARWMVPRPLAVADPSAV